MRFRYALFVALMVATCGLMASARAQTAELTVKATFLYRFASFVSWPAGAFAGAGAPIRVCVVGAEPFAHELTRTVLGQRVGGRVFEVRSVAGATGVAQCQAIYVAGDRADAVLRAARGAPILTITDSGGGGDTRGMIHFVTVDGRVRFHIDDARAAESQLQIEPRLLSLALSVRRRAAS